MCETVWNNVRFNVWNYHFCSCIPANVALDFDPATLNTAASASTGLFTHLPHTCIHTNTHRGSNCCEVVIQAVSVTLWRCACVTVQSLSPSPSLVTFFLFYQRSTLILCLKCAFVMGLPVCSVNLHNLKLVWSQVHQSSKAMSKPALF